MSTSRVLSAVGILVLAVGMPIGLASAQTPAAPAAPVATPAAQPVPVTPPPAPVALSNALKFEEEKFDWGDIADTEPVSHDIQFTNISSETIKLAVAASCGCTTSAMEKTTFAPGEKGKVTASFNPHGRSGPQTKTLTFTVIEPQGKYAQQMFNVTSNVKALVTIDPPKTFLTEVDHQTGQTARIVITGRKEGFEVLKVEPSSEFVKAKILPAEPVEASGEKLVKIPVEIELGKGAPIGNLSANLNIVVNDDKAKMQPYYVGADVIGDVKATPQQAIIRVQTPATRFETQIRLDTRSGSGFNVHSIDVEGPKDMQIVTDIVKNDEGKSYLVTVSGVTPNRGGMATGFLIVNSESQGNVETMRIPFTAVIQAQPVKPAAAPTAVPAPTVVPTAAPKQ